MRALLGLTALIIGVVGAFDAFVVNAVVSTYHQVSRLLGGSPDASHGFIGLLICVVALIGALASVRYPAVGGVFLLIAGIGFFFVVHWWALLASPQILVASVIAFNDQNVDRASATRSPRAPRAPRDAAPPLAAS